MFKSAIIVAAAIGVWSIPASANPAAPAPVITADSATKFVTGIIDKFNNGDTKAWVAAQVDDTAIIDDFGPHVWNGAASAQRWLDDYTKMASEQGISGGRVDYGKAIAANANDNSAYVVLPTTYRFVQNGNKMASPGSMTFVVKREGDNLKIASWTYSGADPAPEK